MHTPYIDEWAFIETPWMKVDEETTLSDLFPRKLIITNYFAYFARQVMFEI